MAQLEQITAKLLDQKYLFNGFMQGRLQWDGETLIKVYQRLLSVYSDGFDYEDEASNSQATHICKCLRLLEIGHLAPKSQDLIDKSRAFRIISALDDKISAKYKSYLVSRRIRVIIKKEQKTKTHKPKARHPIPQEDSNSDYVFPSVPLPKPCEPHENTEPGPTKPIPKPVQRKKTLPKAIAPNIVHPHPAVTPESPRDFIIPSGRQLQRTPEHVLETKTTDTQCDNPSGAVSLPFTLRFETEAENRIEAGGTSLNNPALTSASFHHMPPKSGHELLSSSSKLDCNIQSVLSPTHELPISPFILKNESLPAVPPQSDQGESEASQDPKSNVIPTGHQIPRTPKKPIKMFNLCLEEDLCHSSERPAKTSHMQNGPHYAECSRDGDHDTDNHEERVLRIGPDVRGWSKKRNHNTPYHEETVKNDGLIIAEESTKRNHSTSQKEIMVEHYAHDKDSKIPPSPLVPPFKPREISSVVRLDVLSVPPSLPNDLSLAEDCVFSPPSGYKDEEDISRSPSETITFVDPEQREQYVSRSPSETFICPVNRDQNTPKSLEMFKDTISASSNYDKTFVVKSDRTFVCNNTFVNDGNTSVGDENTFVGNKNTFVSNENNVSIERTFVNDGNTYVGDENTFVSNKNTFVSNENNVRSERTFVNDNETFIVSNNEGTFVSNSEGTFVSNDEDKCPEPANLETLLKDIRIECTGNLDATFSNQDEEEGKCSTTEDKNISALCENIEQNCSLQESSSDGERKCMEAGTAETPDTTFIALGRRLADNSHKEIIKTTYKDLDDTSTVPAQGKKDCISSEPNLTSTLQDRKKEPMLTEDNEEDDTFISQIRGDSNDTFEIFPHVHKVSRGKMDQQKAVSTNDREDDRGNLSEGNSSTGDNHQCFEIKKKRMDKGNHLGNEEKSQEEVHDDDVDLVSKDHNKPAKRGRPKKKEVTSTLDAGGKEKTKRGKAKIKDEKPRTLDSEDKEKTRRGKKKISNKETPPGLDIEEKENPKRGRARKDKGPSPMSDTQEKDQTKRGKKEIKDEVPSTSSDNQEKPKTKQRRAKNKESVTALDTEEKGKANIKAKENSVELATEEKENLESKPRRGKYLEEAHSISGDMELKEGNLDCVKKDVRRCRYRLPLSSDEEHNSSTDSDDIWLPILKTEMKTKASAREKKKRTVRFEKEAMRQEMNDVEIPAVQKTKSRGKKETVKEKDTEEPSLRSTQRRRACKTKASIAISHQLNDSLV